MYATFHFDKFFLTRGVGTGETGEARASPEIRGCLKSNSQIGKKRNMSGILFFECFTGNYTVPTPLWRILNSYRCVSFHMHNCFNSSIKYLKPSTKCKSNYLLIAVSHM